MSYSDYFKEVDKGASLEEKIATIKYNIGCSANIRKQISAWGGGTLLTVASTNIPEETTKTENEIISDGTDNETNSLYNEISLLDTSDLSEEETINKIKSIIGTRISSIMINRIKLLLYKEYIIYNKMILAATNKDELEELYIIIANIKTKIELLDELEELEDEQETEDLMTATNNNLFFLLSDTGKVIALESLRKNVPREYYPAFKELLVGLKEGKAKGLKRLSRYGYLELKDFKIRVIFDKLSNGNYVILDCFMKKVDTGISYRNNLANRSNQYQRKQESYLNNYKNSDFIKEHEGYLAEILSLLDSKVLEGEENHETRSI